MGVLTFISSLTLIADVIQDVAFIFVMVLVMSDSSIPAILCVEM